LPFDGLSLSPVTRALIAGRERIERGWCQNAGRLGDSVCAGVAIGDVVALGVFREAIGHHDISFWNDSPKRTKEDVLNTFDRAIALSMNA
jgi:hypothetical protein